MEKNKIKIAANIDPDDILKIKKFRSGERRWNKDFEKGPIEEDLDIPGTELDDKMEDIGSEDEENNFYSIGGERHHNLEEPEGEDL